MKTVNLPYYFLLGFNLITLLLYILNPFNIGVPSNHWLAIFYISLCLFLFSIGFKSGIRKGQRKPAIGRYRFTSLSKVNVNMYFTFFIMTFLLKYAYELRVPVFDFSALLQRVMVGIANPDLGYALTLKGPQSFSWSLYVVICFVDGLFFVVNALYWGRLSRFNKAIFLVLFVFELLRWFAAGTSFGIIIMATTVSLAFCCNMSQDYINRKTLIKVGVVLLAVFLLAVYAFQINMVGRAGGEFASNTMNKFSFNSDSWLFTNIISRFSEEFQYLFVYMAFYLVGGYYNFEYAFSCDYDWCFFCGSNTAVTNITDNILGMNIEALNYQTKIFQQFGVDPYIQWHSCYLWLANDFTLLGVPFVLYFIGKMAAYAFMLYRKFNDLLSGVVFILFANMIILLFANNNYMSTIFFSFAFFFPYWFFTRYVKLTK